jgi:transcriptional regulator with XRE-family HTH domain
VVIPTASAAARTDPPNSCSASALVMARHLSILERLESSTLKPVPRKLSYVSTTFWQRIEARLEVVGGDEATQATLARRIKASDAAISAWKSGSTHSPSAENLIAAAEFLKTTERWLWHGYDRRCDAEGNLLQDRASRLDADSITVGEAFQVLPEELKPSFQTAIGAVAKSTAKWVEGVNPERRRKGD